MGGDLVDVIELFGLSQLVEQPLHVHQRRPWPAADESLLVDDTFTLDDVRAHTKASSSCGSCTGLVEALLASTVGEGYDAAPSVKPMCACTEYSHDQVINAIKEDEVMELNLKKCVGCGLCASACPEEAIVMVETESAKAPFKSERAMHEAIARERGLTWPEK